MKRIVIATTLMIVATAGAASAQDVSADSSLRVYELRRAVEAESLAAQVEALRAAAAEDLPGYVTIQGRPLVATAGVTSLQRAARTMAVAAAVADPVSYSISGRLPADASSSSPLPREIVAAIRSDSHLKSMNVGSGAAGLLRSVAGVTAAEDDRPTFNAAFGFESLEEFDAWYGAHGEALHRAISRAGAEDVRFNLSVVPAEPSTF